MKTGPEALNKDPDRKDYEHLMIVSNGQFYATYDEGIMITLTRSTELKEPPKIRRNVYRQILEYGITDERDFTIRLEDLNYRPAFINSRNQFEEFKGEFLPLGKVARQIYYLPNAVIKEVSPGVKGLYVNNMLMMDQNSPEFKEVDDLLSQLEKEVEKTK